MLAVNPTPGITLEPSSASGETGRPPRRPVSATEQARREAWGRDAGAKVAAAYKQTTKEDA